ncbi:hypothetical protein QR680_014456 [Steinernema hermaphroditum]|uniref:3'-5' exonuclease domain-containing protein n=1 Tax=Steinernema hermaphroditum TaxID=289476 RepID=A0AA39I8Y0_9BILA|nr:hypothetical protein QR680_014456 [Steinernema hermaphroditum]
MLQVTQVNYKRETFNGCVDFCLNHYQIDSDGVVRNRYLGEWTTSESDAATPLNPDVRPYDRDSVILVTAENFEKFVKELLRETEIAVDLEFCSGSNHTALIQISTRTQDFILDVIALWRQIPLLGKVFSNPSIVKVFHGAYSLDLNILRSDFGLVATSIFDTFTAMQYLRPYGHSLKDVVRKYCGVSLKKNDHKGSKKDYWKIRPLTPDMIDYAAKDTHYLLYCYDRIKKDLMAKKLPLKLEPLPFEKTAWCYNKQYHVFFNKRQLMAQALKNKTGDCIPDRIFDKLRRDFDASKSLSGRTYVLTVDPLRAQDCSQIRTAFRNKFKDDVPSSLLKIGVYKKALTVIEGVDNKRPMPTMAPKGVSRMRQEFVDRRRRDGFVESKFSRMMAAMTLLERKQDPCKT